MLPVAPSTAAWGQGRLGEQHLALLNTTLRVHSYVHSTLRGCHHHPQELVVAGVGCKPVPYGPASPHPRFAHSSLHPNTASAVCHRCNLRNLLSGHHRFITRSSQLPVLDTDVRVITAPTLRTLPGWRGPRCASPLLLYPILCWGLLGTRRWILPIRRGPAVFPRRWALWRPIWRALCSIHASPLLPRLRWVPRLCCTKPAVIRPQGRLTRCAGRPILRAGVHRGPWCVHILWGTTE